MKLVVVESPAKAKTINKYLGKDYKVLASYGHIRDLPSKNGSVDPENDFEMVWEADAKSAKRISDIANALKDADTLILATDPDREGEAISWHLIEALKKRRALKKDMAVERVVFNAITKSAVTQAMEQPRKIDEELVDAYLARRALDYLVGFNLSPVLWRKLPGSRSAGRVQSVALRIVCDRENEIEMFRPQEYWNIAAELRAPDGSHFEARLHSLDGETLKKFTLGNKGDADRALEIVKAGGYSVSTVEAKPVKRNPPPPFITSTLQQEASRKLGFSAKRTMQAAQKLYEEGRITYMRTDGVNMAEEAYAAARAMIQSNYGARYLPENTRRYSSKAKNAQEAHEAVRPTDFNLRPEDYHGDGDLKKLYTLVWRRAVASQMEAAVFERTTIDLISKDKRAGLRATGQVVVFDGYIKLYTEGHDAGDDDDDAEGRLPKMAEGQHADLLKAEANQSFTQPPPRYTEASLVKRLEELGIGRPSTYASTLSTLEDRGYVRIEGKALVPEDKGRLVTAFLENFFSRYVEYDFTAGLEEKLDVISDGKLDWKAFLREFWQQFAADIDGTKELRVSAVLDALNEALGAYVFPRQDAEGNPIENPRQCPLCKEGELSMKLGKFGAFVGCSRHPECKYTRQFSSEGGESAAISPDGNELGVHPDTGETIFLKSGRFGPYVEMANGEKPKRASLTKADKDNLDGFTLARAVELLMLPREVGPHPEDGEMILANFGRFGPYVQHGKTYANLKDPRDVFTIGVNHAVALIEDKKARGSARAGAAALKTLGDHPDGGAIEVFEGRYGPYVKWGKVNATLPKDVTPDVVTLEQAIELVNAKGGSAKKKAPAKKAAAKKPAAKKAAPKKKAAAKKDEA
ncbi:DNA topoisomerase I subunit omega [Hyphomonas polymorpha PS728]|uniref:DNA topoisomerase 1 n=1 Tax=Hyphomonas polymorpha PS728 TaxID=1280954 RepID=A0A062VJW7_9PROT|nr:MULTISPECIES: type I DNA topoisomerase [Hyphomonas]AXE63788.1 DNA topoisomerase I [Hyphomonas sp. CACIAM 19H1]KCZ99927.1 DNA topoisomerase I subunit omega [Hyphomonas polymorpha PS728]